ncbi:chromosome segregation protein SMC [Eubacterium sp. am_0171]|uniref:ATP-binding protein n=1 Tax=unclassified Eubacterium (in: firmicutes) TaxID=2624479 RepID=UPI00101EE3A2|nr:MULTISPECIES: SbcC/MukB-like Walker B domain-containing protein [unclassified Eubacterium (in: firmicutes)]MSC82994.1 AAA family ATPase [Eubacterium sp. BIOML-A1]MSD04587.1 AAA family ATPase [Eubacterium sp. BIOML-A2]RYT25766.1 chromosome segregation protein SMC [Eubacterium sp. am_0171]
METKQPFKALSKICLNNWHYIDRKILTLNEGINFFTGHSGSGKSTVIDALQIVLYANTDGRGFFNKAAADDSDRTLIEYLRGMVNISENNESQYLRNHNFSSTIVLELEQTNTHEKQCVGVVFDVETATNEIGRLFFWHTGGLLENGYRADKRCLTTGEIREYLQRVFPPEQHYCGPSNERFRRQLYDIYLGGLDMEKFPRLFKRAIPFRMNIKLEDFVKEYICMEQDIHIEDLQESVMQYGRMRNKIEETLEEIRRLKEIRESYGQYRERRREAESCTYQIDKLEMLLLRAKIQELSDKIGGREEEISRQETMQRRREEDAARIQKEYEDVLLRISNSGYSGLETELLSVNEALERLSSSKVKWEQTAGRLKDWTGCDAAPNQVLWDIEKFGKGSITEGELERLKESLAALREELEEERRETDSRLRKIKKEEHEAREELKELRQGRKAYPKELEEARYELRNRLHERCGKFVNVQILADLLDIRDERWHNAVEGYLGNNKLLLVVEPQYAKAAMDIYQEMDKKKFFRAAVLDTEKVLEEEHSVRPGALAGEVTAREAHVKAYIDFFLGNVMKCESVEELRRCRVGVTPDCVLYHSYRLQHMNPENYTRRAYIGETSMRQRIRQLEEKCRTLQEERMPLQEMLEQFRKIGQFEGLLQPVSEYMEWLDDVGKIPGKERQKKQLTEKMRTLREESVSAWEAEKLELMRRQEEKKMQIRTAQEEIWKNKEFISKCKSDSMEMHAQLADRERYFKEDAELEALFAQFMEGRRSVNYDYLRRQRLGDRTPLEEKKERAYQELVDIRSSYTQRYPNRTFSASIKDNGPYDRLLESLECDDLEGYKEAAREQARSAVEHFKDDFIFKIRSAIREAYQRKDELNRIISRLDFGKDKYQFVITKNKGPDGKYYRMFMDDSLKINPSQLTHAMENQLNMFTMEHEDQYGDMMNELINIFIPPENATREELEEAKKNMDKYADYRTYLSFDMQQIVQGEKDMTIGLSKMIKKNSGGEGQNPLYVALLASFAQVYRINLSPKIHRNPTIRLVVLDEAFSKMDAEKVASCISLIRGLGFQAIISATNDKIQNYLENVDKTFVYANPNKKHISIQEFERTEFGELVEEE